MRSCAGYAKILRQPHIGRQHKERLPNGVAKWRSPKTESKYICMYYQFWSKKKSHTMDLPIEIENEQAIQDSAGSEREIE